MAIATYSDLLSAIADYLARDDLTSVIPTFVQLTEAKLNRNLYVPQMEQRATAIFDTNSTEPEFISLPSDFQSMRRIRLSSVTGKPHVGFLPAAQMDDYRYSIGDTAGRPLYFTVFGTEMEFAPSPDDDYTIEMVYRKNIPALASNSTNWLLTDSPDAYLYGALMEAAPYLKDDGRIEVWAAGFSSAIQALNAQGLSTIYNAGPLQIRTTGVTP